MCLHQGKRRLDDLISVPAQRSRDTKERKISASQVESCYVPESCRNVFSLAEVCLQLGVTNTLPLPVQFSAGLGLPFTDSEGYFTPAFVSMVPYSPSGPHMAPISHGLPSWQLSSVKSVVLPSSFLSLG